MCLPLIQCPFPSVSQFLLYSDCCNIFGLAWVLESQLIRDVCFLPQSSLHFFDTWFRPCSPLNILEYRGGLSIFSPTHLRTEVHPLQTTTTTTLFVSLHNLHYHVLLTCIDTGISENSFKINLSCQIARILLA